MDTRCRISAYVVAASVIITILAVFGAKTGGAIVAALGLVCFVASHFVK